MQEIKLALKGESEEAGGMMSERRGSETEFFLQRMVAIRQAEVREMSNLRLSRRAHKEEYDLLATLFPDYQKERGLASVLARRDADALS